MNLRIIRFYCSCKILLKSCLDLLSRKWNFCNNLVTWREITFAIIISPNPTIFAPRIEGLAGRQYVFIRFYLETVVYKISPFALSFLSFLGPWELFIWPHTDENMPKHNALFFSGRTSSSSHVRVPTPACMPWACPEGARAAAMWTYGPCSCSAPSPALTLAQRPSMSCSRLPFQPRRAPGHFQPHSLKSSLDWFLRCRRGPLDPTLHGSKATQALNRRYIILAHFLSSVI